MAQNFNVEFTARKEDTLGIIAAESSLPAHIASYLTAAVNGLIAAAPTIDFIYVRAVGLLCIDTNDNPDSSADILVKPITLRPAV